MLNNSVADGVDTEGVDVDVNGEVVTDCCEGPATGKIDADVTMGGGAISFPLFRTKMPRRMFSFLSFGRLRLSKSSIYSGRGCSFKRGMIYNSRPGA